jgi:hypothetical protein
MCHRRHDLLARGNPLGFAYTLYAFAELGRELIKGLFFAVI